MDRALDIMWLTAVVLVAATLLVLAGLVALRLLGKLSRQSRQQRKRQAARRLAGIMSATARTGETVGPFILSERRQARYERVALGMIDDVEGPEREALVRALGQLGTRERALARLERPEVPVRLFAVRTLGLFQDGAAKTGLEAALDDPVLSVRLAAASQLLRRGSTPEELDLARRLAGRSDGNLPLPDEASDGLSVMDISLVAQQLFAQTPPERDDSGEAQDLQTRLSHADWQVRVAAARAIGPDADGAIRARLEDLRTDPVWPVRTAAAATLARLGGGVSAP